MPDTCHKSHMSLLKNYLVIVFDRAVVQERKRNEERKRRQRAK